jgi:hypothetical protein
VGRRRAGRHFRCPAYGAEKGLASPLPRSRNWVALGLEAHGAAALPALAAALARETDPAARQVLADLVERLLAK